MELERPDGARIHYEVRGEGPLVVLALAVGVVPSVYEQLVADLARDHLVATWDPRGCGDSSVQPPFTLRDDADDLLALIGELGGPAKLFAAGQGVNVAAYAVVRQPDAISSVLAHGVTTALLGELDEAEGIATSRPVLEMLFTQFRRDPRASTRSLLRSLNPQLSEDELRERVGTTVAYLNLEAARERLGSWLADGSSSAELRELGDRLYVLEYETDEWQEGTTEKVVELLPQAQIRSLVDGPLSRPDLSAALVRELP